MAGLFELAALETNPRNLGLAPNTPAPPQPLGLAPTTPGPQTMLGAQPQGGLFSDPTALAMMGSYLMAAGAPSLDPGHFGRTIAQMVPAMAQYRQGQQQQQALAQYRQQQLDLQRQKMNRPISGAPGTQFVDPNDPSKVLHRVPFRPKLMTPEEMEQQIELRRAGAARTNINMPPRPEPGYQVVPREGGGFRTEPIPGSAAERKVREQELAKQSGVADVAAQAEESIGLIDRMLEHPGMSDVVGMPGSAAGLVAQKLDVNPGFGTDAAGFMALLKQIQGKQFLAAFETLKGGGQITETEGRKATEAMSRLGQTGQSEEEYIKAARELQDILRKGVDRARKAAGLTETNTDAISQMSLDQLRKLDASALSDDEARAATARMRELMGQ